MKTNSIVGIVVVAVLIIGAIAFMRAPAITNFEECIKAGNPAMESYPRQCRTADGKTFTEDVGGQLDKDNMIRVASPMPNSTITSPLTIKGMARGSWFFEASFPIKLVNADGQEVPLPEGYIMTTADWMTTEFVPFEKTITFPAQKPGKGTLILMKDNPSGLPENDDQLEIPVIFK